MKIFFSHHLCRPVTCDLVLFTTERRCQVHSRNLPVVSVLFGKESGIPACSHMLFYPSVAPSTVRLPSSPYPPPVSSGPVQATVSSALCLSPRLCLVGCLPAFPSFCSHALALLSVGWSRLVYISSPLPHSLIPLPVWIQGRVKECFL